MFYRFLYPLRNLFFGFNLFRYITFRSVYAVVTAVVLSWILTPWIIRLARRKRIGERVREDGPQGHRTKSGTPTMGGVAILLTVFVTVFLWARWGNRHMWVVMAALAGFGLLGFVDDSLKLMRKKGLAMPVKFIAQTAIATALVWWIRQDADLGQNFGRLYLPFLDLKFDLGLWSVPVAVLVVVFSSNMVNLTDGLDGLAGGLVMIAALAFMVLAYAASNYKIASYLGIPFVRGAGELTVVAAALAGALVGFLWYNVHPAEIFMGDTGALPLGGVLGVMAVLLRKEVTLFLVGGVFVAEALSVMVQIGSFRLFRRRVFLMAPLHHHLELKGWPESKVVFRLWILGAVLALVGLSTLKIR